MSWASPEPVTGGVVYGGFGGAADVVTLDDIDDDVRECLRAYIQGDLDHLAVCIKCQEDGLAQEEGVLDDYPQPPDYCLLTPKR
jgi:hypothetical protein